MRSYTSKGELCPSGVTGWSFSNNYFSLALEPFLTEEAPLRGSCRLDIGIEIPAGYKFRNAKLDYDVDATGTFTFTRRAMYREGGSWGPTTRAVTDADQLFEDSLGGDWSDTCSDPKRADVVHLQIDIDAELTPRSSTTLTISGRFSFDHGVEWARCESDSSVVPNTVGKNNPCTTDVHQCHPELICDLYDTPSLTRGMCVDPDEQPEPQPLGEECGGVLQTPCAGEAKCHHSSRDRATTRGVCVPPIGRESDACGGYPDIACAEGLFCLPGTKRCAAGGGHGDLCDREGLPECGTGLICIAGQCTRDLASAGESCAPETHRTCKAPSVCDEATWTCVEAEPIPGKSGALCGTDDQCESGLLCRFGRCYTPPSGELNSACRVTEECQTGLHCIKYKCSEPGRGDVGTECTHKGDCQPELACVQNVCAYEFTGGKGSACRSRVDCLGGLACIGDICQPDPDAVGERAPVCRFDSDCASDFACVDGYCQAISSEWE